MTRPELYQKWLSLKHEWRSVDEWTQEPPNTVTEVILHASHENYHMQEMLRLSLCFEEYPERLPLFLESEARRALGEAKALMQGNAPQPQETSSQRYSRGWNA